VTFRVQGRLPPGGGDPGYRFNIGIHWDPFTITGYEASVSQDGSARIVRRDAGQGQVLAAGRVAFDPGAQDIILELRSAGEDGEVIEFRAWPEDEADEATTFFLAAQDPIPRRSGSVAIGAGALLPEICVRWAEVTVTRPDSPGRQFRRGYCNDDGTVDISDAVCVLEWLFLGREEPGCVAATNVNGDEAVDISDAVSLLGFLFLGGPTPVAPYPDCGTSDLETDRELGCERSQRNCP
jgi:hypothetical protein